MEEPSQQRGRPAGATTFEAEPALAFGSVVRQHRKRQEITQEALADLAGIERSHMGKIERGEHLPTLAAILRIARALNCSSAVLMADTEQKLITDAEKKSDAAPKAGGP